MLSSGFLGVVLWVGLAEFDWSSVLAKMPKMPKIKK